MTLLSFGNVRACPHQSLLVVIVHILRPHRPPWSPNPCAAVQLPEAYAQLVQLLHLVVRLLQPSADAAQGSQGEAGKGR